MLIGQPIQHWIMKSNRKNCSSSERLSHWLISSHTVACLCYYSRRIYPIDASIVCTSLATILAKINRPKGEGQFFFRATGRTFPWERIEPGASYSPCECVNVPIVWNPFLAVCCFLPRIVRWRNLWHNAAYAERLLVSCNRRSTVAICSKLHPSLRHWLL